MEMLLSVPLKLARIAAMYSCRSAACSAFSSSVNPADWDLW